MRPNLPVNTRRSAVDARSFLTPQQSTTSHFSRLTTQWLSDSLITDEMGRLEALAGGRKRSRNASSTSA